MRAFLLVSVCSAAIVYSGPAAAQQAPAASAAAVANDPLSDDRQPAEPAADSAGEIVVTGSRIRGTGPVGSNSISIGNEELLQQPTATVTEFLRKVPQIQGFGIDASSSETQGSGGTNTYRGSAINLRGLGPQATLTLLDGQRLAPGGSAGNYSDPTVIPAIAIERLEIVADGASAVYGSDAVAGVVNFITRKNYDGVMARARYGVADGYWLAQGSLLAGTTWTTGGITLAYEHTERNNLNGGERDYVRSDLRDFGGADYRNSQCNPGNIIVGGRSYAIPAGGVTPSTAGNLVPGTRNLCENLRFGDILPAENRDSFVLNARQDLTSRLSVNAQVLFSHRDYVAKAVQQGSTSVIANLTVPATNAFFVRPPGTNPNSLTVEYDFSSELGLVNQTGGARDWRVTASLDWDAFSDWKISLAGVYGEDETHQYTLRISTPSLNRALASNDPSVAFNPFGGGNTQAALDAIFTGFFNPYGTNVMKGGSVQASGSLYQNIRLAIGAEILDYSNTSGSLQGELSNPTQRDFAQKRQQRSVFGELFVPVFTAANAIPGFERLDLSLAGRLDDYETIGSTLNPKVGVNWSPVSGLLLKGTYGTSFRAPSLQDTPIIRTGSSLNVVTWLDPLSPTGSSVGITLNAGNPSLKPESATTYSLTAELRPDALPGLRLSSTYFSIKYEDVINFPPRTSQSLLDPTYAFAITRNPSNALIQSYMDLGLGLTGVRPASPAFFYNGQPVNLGSVNVDGIDFSLDYRHDSNIGYLVFNVSGSYLFNYKVAVSDAGPSVQQLGKLNYPVVFRSQASVGWERDGFSVEALFNYIDDYKNDLVTPVQRVGSYTPVDIHIGYAFPDDGGYLEGLSLDLSVSNIFNERAPFVNIVGGFDPGQASALGRFAALTVTKAF